MGLIADAIAVLQRARETCGDHALVAFSGGKDSIACAVVAKRVFPQVSLFCMLTVPGLDCEEGHARRMAERLDCPIRFYPHWQTTQQLKALSLGLHSGGLSSRRAIKYTDIEALARYDTAAGVVILGWRESDSDKRIAVIRRWGAFDAQRRRAYPLHKWLDRDVYAMIRANKFPLPPRFGSGRVSGVSVIDPEVLLEIRTRYPGDYERIKEVFPHVEAITLRAKLRAARGVAD